IGRWPITYRGWKRDELHRAASCSSPTTHPGGTREALLASFLPWPGIELPVEALGKWVLSNFRCCGSGNLPLPNSRSPNLVRGGRNSAPPVLAEVDGKSVSWINTYGGSPAPEPHVATPVPVFIRPFPRPRPRKSVDNPKSDIVAIGRPDNPPSSPHSHVHPDWPEPCYPSCYGHRQSSLSALSKTIPSDTCEVWDRTSCYNSG
ncbi:hypothetical protein BKA81DRAFT_366565, partial [Phyllosticta paracitricarpa]